MSYKSNRVTYVTADWKDTEGLINGFKKALKKHGVRVYKIPSYSGSDSYGFILSDTKLTPTQIKQLDTRP